MTKLADGKEILLRNFSIHDFDSPDQYGSGINMKFEVLQKLMCLRDYVNEPLFIASGFRTIKNNIDLKGAQHSAHLKGEGVDITCCNSQLRYKIIYWLIMAGVTRIEVGSNWIHFDISKTLPQKVIFLP